MKTNATTPFLTFLFAIAPVAFGQHQTFTANPDASKIAFTLGGTGHHVEGTFHVQSGRINFDRSAQTISGAVVVAAGSGDSGEPSRDKKMNSDVLEVARFAEVSFVPKSYQGAISAAGDSTIQVTGVFTLHGTPHDLTVPMQIHIDGPKATATAHFIVPYVQWGLKNPSFLIWKAENDVAIDLSLVGKIAN